MGLPTHQYSVTQCSVTQLDSVFPLPKCEPLLSLGPSHMVRPDPQHPLPLRLPTCHQPLGQGQSAHRTFLAAPHCMGGDPGPAPYPAAPPAAPTSSGPRHWPLCCVPGLCLLPFALLPGRPPPWVPLIPPVFIQFLTFLLTILKTITLPLDHLQLPEGISPPPTRRPALSWVAPILSTR